MRFALTQAFAAPVDAVARAYAGAELYATFAGLPRLGAPDVLDRVADGDRVRLRLRYRFTGELAPAVTAVVDPDKLTWVEESDHDLAARTVTIRLLPDHYADRLRCTGRYSYQQPPPDGAASPPPPGPHPADRDRPAPTGTLRHVEGELTIRVPLVAGRVERAIVSGLSERLAAEAPAVDAFLGR